MSRVHRDPVLQPGQSRQRRDHGRGITARQVDPPPPPGEQRVAAVEESFVLREEADRALGVAWRVEHAQADVAEPDEAALRQLDGRDGRDDLERRPERPRIRQPLTIQGMDGDLGSGVLGGRRVIPDVIPVPVGRDDELERPVARSQLDRKSVV